MVIFYVKKQLKSGLGCLNFKVSRSHTGPPGVVGLLWMSDQLVAEAATYTKHNWNMVRASMPSAKFEPAIPAIKQSQNYTLERSTTGIAKYLS